MITIETLAVSIGAMVTVAFIIIIIGKVLSDRFDGWDDFDDDLDDTTE